MLKNQIKYSQNAFITLTAGAFTIQQFACNGLYHPDTTTPGTTTQPLYFDQLMAVYNHYAVVSSKISIQLAGSTATNNSLGFGVYVDDDTTGVTAGFRDLITQPGSQWGQCNTLVSQPKMLYAYWNSKRFFGTDTPWKQDELSGSVGANPAEMSHFTIGVTDLSSQTATWVATVEIVYDVVWEELKTLPSS